MVPVIGRADDDGIDVFAIKNLLVILGGEDVRAMDFLHMGEAAVVAIAGGDQLRQAGGDGGTRIALPHAATADEGDLDFVVGGDLSRFDLASQQGRTGGGD